MKETQSQKILTHLLEGNHLSHLTAVKLYGIMQFHARVKELKEGSYDKVLWPIRSKAIKYGKVHYNIYYFKDADIKKLRQKYLTKKSIQTEI